MKTNPPKNYIKYISKNEGDPWKELPRPVKLPTVPVLIMLRREKKNNQITFYGMTFHAFKTNYGRVWDCINGWRKGREESSK